MKGSSNGGHEELRNGHLSPRSGIEAIREMMSKGVSEVTFVRPDGSQATYQPRRGRWRGILDDVRDPQVEIKHLKIENEV